MTTYYIRTIGSDYNNGLSGSGAWKTLDNANRNMVAGDIVYIGAGNYSVGSDLESWVWPQNNGVSGSYITYYGDRFGTYTGDVGDIIVEEISPTDYTQVIGIKATLSVHGYVSGINSIIDQCKFPWIAINNLKGVTVKNCIIYNDVAGYPSINSIGGNLGNIYFYFNTIIHDCTGSQVVLNLANNDNVYFKNNIVYRKQGTGHLIHLDNYETKTHFNNNCYYSGSYVNAVFGDWHKYDCGAGAQTEINFEEWQADAICDACGSRCDGNSIKTDPTFVGGSDYHLQVASPCINVGTDVGIYYDYEGVVRPQGVSYDIGAYEYVYHPTQQLILSDANIVGTNQQIIISDAYIYFEVYQQLIKSDANIVGTNQQIIISDANVAVQNLQFILSNAKIHPATSADYFSFARIPKDVSNFSLKTQDETKIVLYDVKLEHICDHNLPSGKFTLNTCPRCLGKGFYYDLKFSPLGDVFTVKEVEKLLQELVKITITSKGSNPFHEDYGSYVIDSVGALQTEGFRETKLKQSIMDAVLRLRYLQREGIERGYKFSLKELIDKIESIEFYEVEGNPTQLGFKVRITNVEGSMAILQGSISL